MKSFSTAQIQSVNFDGAVQASPAATVLAYITSKSPHIIGINYITIFLFNQTSVVFDNYTIATITIKGDKAICRGGVTSEDKVVSLCDPDFMLTIGDLIRHEHAEYPRLASQNPTQYLDKGHCLKIWKNGIA